MSNGHRVKGVAKGIFSRLQPSVGEVTPVERIMRLRLKHSLGFMSVVAVYAPTEVCVRSQRGEVQLSRLALLFFDGLTPFLELLTP